MDVLALLRRRKPSPTAADLRAALPQAEQESAAADARVRELSQARTAALLEADDTALDTLESDLGAAQRTADRLEAAVVALRERLGAAELEEHQASVDAIFARGQAALTTGLSLYTEYGNRAVAMRELIEQLRALDAEINSCNAQLRDAADERSLPDLDTRARPGDPSLIREGGPWRHLRLPSSVHASQPLYPCVDPNGFPSPDAIRLDR